MDHKKRGPQIPEIKLFQVRELAEIGCTQSEAAAVLGISRSTFEVMLRNDPEMRMVWDAGQDVLRVSVRRSQLAILRKGNVVMGIWLGKQLLGQRDKIDMNTGNPVYDFSKLTDEERVALERITDKLSAGTVQPESEAPEGPIQLPVS